MKIRSVGYCTKQGFKNIGRNRLFSLASIATIASCIFLFCLFFCIVVNFENMVQETEKNLCVTVFFEKDITDEQIQKIGDELKLRTEVERIEFISADEAWENFKVDYFAGYEELAEDYKDDNPLVYSASYAIYLNDSSMQDTLVTFLKNTDGIRRVNYSADTASNITDVAKLVGYISIGIIVILLAVSVFLISNTVAVGVTVRKEEISIMKLVGATDSFVRAPFIVEGILIGLIGSVIPLAIIYFSYEQVVQYIGQRLSLFASTKMFLPMTSVMTVLVPVSLLLGIGIGFVGSSITLQKHVKI
jgi:cell division transport system permease protein